MKYSFKRSPQANSPCLFCTTFAFLLLLIFNLASAGSAFAQKFHCNPAVVPPNALYRGLSYGKWGAELWKTLLSIPVEEGNPYYTGDPFVGPQGMVFLIFPLEGALEIEIPVGSPIFCAILAHECSTLEPPPWFGANGAELRANANLLVSESSEISAEIDGVAVKNLECYRAQSPIYRFGPLPNGNLFDDLYSPLNFDGKTGSAVAAGVYLIIPSLSPGKHVIHAHALYPASVGGYLVDGTYNITVVRRPR